MNETDCEKIEEKLGKYLTFQSGECSIEHHYDGKGEDSVFDVTSVAVGVSELENNNFDTINMKDIRHLTALSSPTPNESSNGQQEQQQQQRKAQQLLDTTAAEEGLSELYCATDESSAVVVLVQSDSEDSPHPLSERWSPLGANYDDAMSPTSELLSPESELELLSSDSQDNLKLERHDPLELARLRSIEDEQELLTSSLLALTSHFAHVQLRVRQIVEAPSHERDQLLKDLEEFAFRGIPESTSLVTSPSTCVSSAAGLGQHTGEDARQQQFELIDRLKTQLSELEKFAYESGAPVLPQHMLLEKQKMIIDELKQRLNLKMEEHDLPELSPEQLKSQVDHAIGEFVGPLKMKEQLVAQLKTQITDLERFIAFLQCDADDSKLKILNNNEKFSEAYNSYAAKKKKDAAAERKKPPLQLPKNVAIVQRNAGSDRDECDSVLSRSSGARHAARETSDAAAVAEQEQGAGVRESLHSKAHGLMDKASLLMQMFATTHFGSKAEHFQKNTLKKTSKGNHWGDLRAQLEVDIQEVASLAATLNFDREKLAKMRHALKQSAQSAQNGNGALTTIPPHGSRQQLPANCVRGKQLKTYAVSSDSDEENTYDCYDWQQTSRRMARQGGDSISTISKELTAAVRKNFAMTLQRLIQHGLRVETESATSSLIVPFMRCLNPSPVFAGEHASYGSAAPAAASSFVATAAAANSAYSAYGDDFDGQSGAGFFGSGGSRQMHAWELILEYYYLKHGDEYNNTPARKLSQSFNLDIVDSQAVTAKQSLLSAIGMIIAMHRPYKRSFNAHFKAFICAGLNSHQLVEWLNLIFSCNDLIDAYYTSNSYVVRTGFRDSLRSIDALSKYDFDLPVDLAVRHFRNI